MLDIIKKIFSEFGAQVGFLLVTVVALWWVGRRLFGLYDRITASAEKREEALRGSCHSAIKDLAANGLVVAGMERDTTQALAEIRKANEEAHGYQREEHREMVNALQAIQLNLAKINGGE